MKRLALPLLLLLPGLAAAQSYTVTNGPKDAANVVVVVPDAKLPYDVSLNGSNVMAQASDLTKSSIVVVGKMKGGETATIGAFVRKPSDPQPGQPQVFVVQEKPGEYVDFVYGKPVLRFVNKPRTQENHYLTFKPFHQVFDPATGKSLLSSGAHPNVPEFKFPHHRGLFFGFNKITYGDKKAADIWHGTKNVFSTTDKILSTELGPVFARQVAAISWHGEDGVTFADEERDVTVYNAGGGTLIDWKTTLSTKLPKVRLDGDPQHAGFHFRATQEVSKTTAKQTYYLRPDGKGKEGETRNWDAKAKDSKSVNLPWNAMSFVTDGKRFTALRINHPDNPGESRGSERDYGRFGDYFEYDLTPEKPLKLKYRVWVQQGEMTQEQCEAMAVGFVQKVDVKGKK